jgi:Tol biopolymer transport system component
MKRSLPFLLGASLAFAGSTQRVSVGTGEAGLSGLEASISADGSVVAFANANVRVYDRRTRQSLVANVDARGTPGGSANAGAALSADGLVVAFSSTSSILVPGDLNGAEDVFVHDLRTRVTTRVSVSSSGAEGNRASRGPAISADGRFVAFASFADNLVAADTNNADDVFVHDRLSGVTVRVSRNTLGVQGNQHSRDSAISGDGRFVAFGSDASNLVFDDTNQAEDVFVHDRSTGATVRVSVDATGREGNRASSRPSLSADGALVAFDSLAGNLVFLDTNGVAEVFVRDLASGAIVRVSQDAGGAQANAASTRAALAGSGCCVAFQSDATNLVAEDRNGATDVFLHRLGSAGVERVSLDANGGEVLRPSLRPDLSGDGRFVAFDSDSDRLVPGDRNTQPDVFVRDRTRATTERVSVSSPGVEGNARSHGPRISADGRFLGCSSDARSLLDDGNQWTDAFVLDRLAQRLELVSVSTGGQQGNTDVWLAALSGDGRLALLESRATNLVPGDTNDRSDVFVRDRQALTTERVSLTWTGGQADEDCEDAVISRDGRFVAFVSRAGNLAPQDVNGNQDVFVRDLLNGTTILASYDERGLPSPNPLHFGREPSLSADGTLVAFATNVPLVPEDQNGLFVTDVYVRDLRTGAVRRASVSTSGVEANGPCGRPRLTPDGRYVVFESNANNLAPADPDIEYDVYVHDLWTRTTAVASLGPGGAAGGGRRPSVSDDGALVAFESDTPGLVPDDRNDVADAFVHDRRTRRTLRASVDSAGREANGESEVSVLSSDGSRVFFASRASNLVPGDRNGTWDVFVRDLDTSLSSLDVPRVGQAVRLALGTRPSAGAGYFLGCAFGYTPGFRVDLRDVPLNLDPLFLSCLLLPELFQDFTGVFDAGGSASARIVLPADARLAGLLLYGAFATLVPGEPSGIRSLSNALELVVQP